MALVDASGSVAESGLSTLSTFTPSTALPLILAFSALSFLSVLLLGMLFTLVKLLVVAALLDPPVAAAATEGAAGVALLAPTVAAAADAAAALLAAA